MDSSALLLRHGDVTPFAAMACSKCHGRGEVIRVQEGGKAKLCKCAIKRFMRVHGGFRDAGGIKGAHVEETPHGMAWIPGFEALRKWRP